MENLELTHWGVRGMRWGVRRYQNKDGTLTNRGKKRYAKELAKVREEEKILKNRQATKAKIDRLNARKQAVEDGKRVLDGDKKSSRKSSSEVDTQPKKKSIKDMSDDELNKVVRRAQLEKQYKDLHPEEVSRGKKFIKDTLGSAFTSAAKTCLTDYATKKGREYLGLSKEDPDEALKKKVNRLTLEKRLKDLTASEDK